MQYDQSIPIFMGWPHPFLPTFLPASVHPSPHPFLPCLNSYVCPSMKHSSQLSKISVSFFHQNETEKVLMCEWD